MTEEETEDPGQDEEKEEGVEALATSEELEAALRAATKAVDEHKSGGRSPEGEAATTDKMTIEALSGELQIIKTEYEESVEKLKESEDTFLRLQAEFDNFRRRTLKEKQDTFKYGHQNLVKDLLSTVDNLDRAIAHVEESGGGDFQSLLQGVELVRRELMGGLAKHGVEIIEADHAVFDPAVHEAMAHIESDDVPPNTVMQVLQSGFLLRDRMIRPARVVVSKGSGEGNEGTAVGSAGQEPPEGEQ